MSVPLVSVVVSVYNGGAYLGPSLQSILAQTGCAIEVILIDDGSTDDSPRLLAEAASRDGRVRVLSQENRGLTRSLARGCAEAQGEFIARHDADDLSLPSRLAKQAAALQADPRLAFVSCWLRTIGPGGELLGETTRPVEPSEATALLLREMTGPYHGSVMFRADAYRRAGGYRAAFRYAQDWDLWLRLAEVGPIAYVPEFLYAFRVSEQAISSTRQGQQRRLAEQARHCREARLHGEPETPHLETAAAISAEQHPSDRRSRSASNYFIGKCLLDRRDPRAAGYLQRSLRQNPWQWRGWVALGAARFLCYPHLLSRRG